MIYHCNYHGNFDSDRAWGCPDCMVEARSMIQDLETALREIMDDWWHKLPGCPDPTCQVCQLRNTAEAKFRALISERKL